MKSFGIKRDEKDPRWKRFIEWCNDQDEALGWRGTSSSYIYYGYTKHDRWDLHYDTHQFDRIITLDEWESEFMQPKLAGREYDEKLLRDYCTTTCGGIDKFLDHRYANTGRISELKQQIEKLTNELKELES